MLSFIVVDSRSDKHPQWVKQCIESLENQLDDNIEIIVINNVGRKKTIGQAFNEGVLESQGEWVCFVGDDDYVAPDYSRTLKQYINHPKVKSGRVVNVATYMTAFNNDTGQKTALPRQSTGAWKRSYLLKHPFNEKLDKGIDREYIEQTIMRGDLSLIIEYYFGYFYRRHSDYRCAGDIIFEKEPADFYFTTTNRIFLHPITERLKDYGKVFVDNKFTHGLAEKAKVIWCEWANDKSIEISNTKLPGKKILRVHAYEAFTNYAKDINWNGFDVVIFIDDYIKDYVERQYGKVSGAVVIPNGVDLTKYNFDKKERNNKVAYAGYLTRKKGIGELLLIAKSFPDYEFHLAGKYQEDDICDWFNYKKPDNIIVDSWRYDLAEWYKDKTYIINTSLRESQAMTIMEGMASGLKPLVNDWIGASEIYGEYVYKNMKDIEELLRGSYEPKKYREFVKQYDIEKIYPKIEELFELKAV